MRYLASRVAWAVLFCVVLTDSGFAQVGLRLNEARVRFRFALTPRSSICHYRIRRARPFLGMCWLNWWTHAVLFGLKPTKMHCYLPVQLG